MASHTDVRGFEPQCGGRLSEYVLGLARFRVFVPNYIYNRYGECNQIQQTYNSTETIFDLNSLSFRPVLRFVLPQKGDKIPKADLAFLIRLSMSKSAPPLASIPLLRCVNLSTASTADHLLEQVHLHFVSSLQFYFYGS